MASSFIGDALFRTIAAFANNYITKHFPDNKLQTIITVQITSSRPLLLLS